MLGAEVIAALALAVIVVAAGVLIKWWLSDRRERRAMLRERAEDAAAQADDPVPHVVAAHLEAEHVFRDRTHRRETDGRAAGDKGEP